MSTNDTFIKQQWQDQEALHRFQLISPLLQTGLDDARRLQLRRTIAEENSISVRTLYRYEKSFAEKQFAGLRPADREKHRSQSLPENFEFLLEQAVQLRREVPERSVAQIIYILEAEGLVAPGILKRSALERHIYRAGYGQKQMQMYKEARNSSSRRFCKPHRMMLVQGDIKYGPKLPIGKNGAKVQTYLSSAIDDHSRYLLFSRFYDNQEESIIEDTFHQAISRYGVFDACYFDNGSQYIAKQIRFSLARLGIRVMHAKPRSGKSKGKIEKFHQVVDDFIRESKLKNIRTLEDLNRLWAIYLEEYYHKQKHAGIAEYYESLGAAVPEEGISPLQEWNRDSRPLTFLDAAVVSEAFLHHEQRKVDRGACISFRGKRYETKPSLIGHTVEISYDPSAPEQITVSYQGMEPFTAMPVVIGPYCDKSPALPASMQEQPPATSRFLDALEKRHEQNQRQMVDVCCCNGGSRMRKINPDQLGLESRFYRGDSKRQLQQEIGIIRGVQHKKVVCILDEAHLLEKETLEEFRFLLNYRFDSMSPMAVVLVGQTELWENKLKLQRYAAVRQRIDMYCTLPHLDRSETEQYIASHMDYSGCTQEVFTAKALDEIHKASAGIPRMVNRICEKALMYAFQNQKRLIDDYMIKFVIEHEMLGTITT